MTKIEEISLKLKNNIQKVFLGNQEMVDMLLACVFAGGHVLIEDVPGTGKTVLAKALARSSGLSFSRIQCTPDLMPSDVTGSSIWLPSTQSFEFKKGPVFAEILLTDELNRATPRTQSALLEAMAENQVSMDGKIYPLSKPFFVIATENPVESEGTFPLPEAQKDRFMMTLSTGYPDAAAEAEIITAQRSTVHPVEQLEAVTNAEEIIAAREEAVSIYVDETVLSYLISLSAASRTNDSILCGVSPRGSIALYKAAQAYAAVKGRNYVVPEDVKLLAKPVFKKRIILKPEALLHGYSADSVIDELLLKTPLPDYKAHV